ncbi:MAG TPA: 50S ribosomal protein L23 [Candidatus Omnitrophota bacterium]|nr:50S ribosomal protein L23 [Candidatus Omnitrophota bacterium]
MLTSHEIIKALLRTEKSSLYQPQGKYLFLVDKKSNKIQIRRSVEEIYKVKVQDVNTNVYAGKLKRVRHQLGRTPEIKKAVVTLREGQKINEAAA